MSDNHPRLIEVAFPLKQASIDSVHEKNVRHGHISTLHIWPARRPLAACRAALIATLLPDPGNKEERDRLLERLGGRVVKVVKKKKLPDGREEEKIVEETVGGILHWGRESSPDLEWFRQEIRRVYGRAPRVLDPFAGGGAIPLEAMRLGCEATAIDINPVAWFLLKCTLEYPQKLAGQTRPLPEFALESREFMEGFYKGTSKLTKKQLEQRLQQLCMSFGEADPADFAWHVRAWGWWVLQRATADLEQFYPMIDDQTTVAYLWARTVRCKNCRATLPLLKTRWLCKKDDKRVLLTMEPNADRTGVIFDVQTDVPRVGGNAAQRREHDKRLGAGTMSRSGAACPCCPATMSSEDIRIEGQQGRLGALMTCVVTEGQQGKTFRLPVRAEVEAVTAADRALPAVFAEVPYGLPLEPMPQGGSRSGGGSPFTTYIYGLTRWCDVFNPRQLLALGTLVNHTRAAREVMRREGYPEEWIECIGAMLALVVDRVADRCSQLATWQISPNKVRNTFARFALPVTWDYAEAAPCEDASGGYNQAVEWVAEVLDHVATAATDSCQPAAVHQTATLGGFEELDIVLTDPPYYDSIPYSDLMDFFHIWLRRTLHGLSADVDQAFSTPLGPKWDHERHDGELIDDASRHGGDKAVSKAVYEDGMARAFGACHRALRAEGRLVVVFANKSPDAWETLVSAIIRAGFVVDGSWPIQTERSSRTRSLASAALSSSVWLVCRKRPETARPGWDTRVLEEMRESITLKLRDFWDAGIRGPDFVWAATGPALEAYSRHPVVKKANRPEELLTVAEFLRHVRRMVVDFVVGRVLPSDGTEEGTVSLDDVTTYYLLHRHDFGLDDAPVGASILYALSCNLSDGALVDQYDLLTRTGSRSASGEEDEDESDIEAEDAPEAEGSGSEVRLKPWQQRKRKTMGYGAGMTALPPRDAAQQLALFDAPADREPRPRSARVVPLIDQVHRLMHLWREGDVVRVDEYLESSGLRHQAVFGQLLQALIELSPAGTGERAILESLSNHAAARGVRADHKQPLLPDTQVSTDDREGTER